MYITNKKHTKKPYLKKNKVSSQSNLLLRRLKKFIT